MDIKQKITLDNLTSESVAIEIEKYITVDDIDMRVGDCDRKIYHNNSVDREFLKGILSTEQLTAVMIVFGYTDETAISGKADEQLNMIKEVYENA